MLLDWYPPSIFPQWSPFPFVVDSIYYLWAEQLNMASKARLLDNDSNLLSFMATTDLHIHKHVELRNIITYGPPMKIPRYTEMRPASLLPATAALPKPVLTIFLRVLASARAIPSPLPRRHGPVTTLKALSLNASPRYSAPTILR